MCAKPNDEAAPRLDLGASGDEGTYAERTLTLLKTSAERALARLDASEWDRMPELRFHFRNTGSPNAWAVPDGQNRVAICIDGQLPALLWHIARALIGLGDPQSDTHPLRAVHVLGLCARFFVSRDPRYLGRLTEMKDKLTSIPAHVSHFMAAYLFFPLEFIVLHEVQHILLGHLDSTVRVRADKQSTSGTIDVYSFSRERELQADAAAALIFARDEPGVRSGTIAFAELFFLFLHSVQQLMGDEFVATTHPPAATRLASVRRAYDQFTGGISAFGEYSREVLDGAFAMFDEVAPTIPEGAWLAPDDVWTDMADRFRQAVVEGKVTTNVCIGGELTEDTLGHILTLLERWQISREHVVGGRTSRRTALLPELALIGDFVAGIAALAALCLHFLALRRESVRREAWTREELQRILNDEFRRRQVSACQPIVEEFDAAIDTDGEICRLVLVPEKGRGCKIILSVNAGAFSIYVEGLEDRR